MKEKSAVTILIVDDSVTMRTMVRGYIEKMGYAAFEVSSGEDALKWLQNNNADMVILDVEMGGMSGYEAAAQIADLARRKNLTMPVVMLTSNDTMESRMKGFESGVSEYLTKPVTSLELEHTVSGVLNPVNDLNGIRILLVEDSETTRMIIRQHLIQNSAVVTEASSGQEAIDRLKESNFEFDVIIMDIYMPDMDGFDVCRYIREKTVMKKNPVIFLSAASNSDDILKVYSVGGSDYINKPFIKDELVAKIRVHNNSYQHEVMLGKILREQKKLDVMKDEFLSVCSHDLRSPMSGIVGLSEILMLNEKLDPEHRETLEFIHTTGENLMGMIEDLLAVTNPLYINNLVMEKISLNDVLRGLTGMYAVNARLKEVSLDATMDSEEIYINGNEGALARIFGNILSNAVKFTSAGGKVGLVLKKEDGNAVVEVSDSGVGMTAEQIRELFAKYKSFGEGTRGEKSTGLGLYIVKTFSKAHNAVVSVKSSPGKGSVFTIRFPLLAGKD